ncbi:transketolase [Pelagibacterales bacterium SAG-MED10]|nr:transketolase [Pelagibacterales bacterium SAG-MED10]
MYQKIKRSNFTLLIKKSQKIRKLLIEMLFNAQSGHAGPSLSIVELLVYFYFSNNDFKNENFKFIISKGHAVPAWYATLIELGLLKKKDVFNLRKLNSKLQGHPDRNFMKEVDSGTGALGQGLSVAIGYAIANKLKKKKSKVICILGDGELQEGQIWEAAMYIGAKKIKNLITIVDNNKFQNELSVEDTLPLGNLKKKWESFGFKVEEINGHSFYQINRVISNYNLKKYKKPLCIIANTIKGKGIPFMENSGEWHSKVISKADYDKCKEYL